MLFYLFYFHLLYYLYCMQSFIIVRYSNLFLLYKRVLQGFWELSEAYLSMASEHWNVSAEFPRSEICKSSQNLFVSISFNQCAPKIFTGIVWVGIPYLYQFYSMGRQTWRLLKFVYWFAGKLILNSNVKSL